MMSKEHNIISGEGGCTIPVPMVGQRSCRGLVLGRETVPKVFIKRLDLSTQTFGTLYRSILAMNSSSLRKGRIK